MNNDFYTILGFGLVWCVKYIFIPIGVAIVARIVADRIRPQPDRQRKNGHI